MYFVLGSVSGLDAAPLPVAPTPRAGDTGVVAGYPFGGPFTEGGARVVRPGTLAVPAGGGGGAPPRALAAVAADVEQGNSGGPLLSPDGAVLGVVFAKSTDRADLGYVMTREEFDGLVTRAPGLAEAVATGTCVRG